MEYEKYLKQNQSEMIETLQRLLKKPSEAAEPVTLHKADGSEEFCPFGKGVQEAFETVLETAKNMGFDCRNIDNYGGHIDFKGTGDKVMAVIGHLDVVPAAGGWSFDPYGGEIISGKICGRGTTDDKGPVISCLYAMKALKDAGYTPLHTIRLIIGLDEETDWKGMDYYFTKVEKPDFGFTPDAEFPIINGEMGILIFDLAKKMSKTAVKGTELRSIKGGSAPNSVADKCRAVIRNTAGAGYDKIKEMAADFREETGYKLYVKGMGKSLEITAEGLAAHGAKPELGINAISIMMEFLGKINFVNEDHNDFISFYNRYIGFCLDGSKMGAGLSDEPSGNLIFNVGMIELEPQMGKITVNIRYPVTKTEEQVFEPVLPLLDRYGFGLVKTKHEEPIYMDLNTPMVKDLLEIYRKHTGDMDSVPLVIGGGTYAKAAKNILAYGAAFPGDPDLMHQKDECISIERLEQMTEIYAEAIYKLSSEEYNI